MTSAYAETPYRALVCITTCRRLHHLHRYLPHFADHCRRDPRFHLLVALDGTEEGYLSFCEEWRVPLVHSDEREGVGLSKNRVLERFGDFDYYFFLDDDVELVDGRVFPRHVELSRASGIHHFSLFEAGGLKEPTGCSVVDGTRVAHGRYGGGQFSFFTREGLDAAGGWHPRFAEYRRWGHTEHSHRFAHAGLAPAPFNVAEELADCCIWHYPPPVSGVDQLERDAHELVAAERELIEAGTRHVPLETLSAHHHNGVPFGEAVALAATLDGGERYPLVRAGERRACRSAYALWRGRRARGLARAAWLARAVAEWPGNPMLRYWLKKRLAG